MPKPALSKVALKEAAGYYLWSFPGMPLKIHLSLSVVPRLRELLMNGLQQDGTERTESGGLLLGRRGQSGIEIDDFYVFNVPRRSRFFVLSESEKSQLAFAIEQRAQDVLGYFRTDIRQGIRLYDDDQSLITELFNRPSDVFLVMHAEDAVTPTGGFFFWDSGFVFGATSFMPFPLDEHVLAAATEPSVGTAPPREGTDPAANVNAISEAWSVDDDPILSSLPKRTRANGRKLTVRVLIIFGVLAVSWLAGFLYFKFRRSVAPASQQTAVISDVSSPMSLSATRSERQLVIAWDSSARAVAEARVGILNIKDGQSAKEIPLTKAQLQMQKLIYEPQNGQIEVGLEVFSSNGTSKRDTVMILFSKSAGVSTKLQVSPLTRRPSVEVAPSTTPTTAAKEVRPFTPPAQVNRTHSPAQVAMQPPPSVQVTSTTPIVISSPDIRIPPMQQLPTAAAPGTPESRNKPAASAAAARLEIQQPQPIRQVKPVVPAHLSIMLKRRIEIDVRLHIDETGEVRQADATAPPGAMGDFLARAAANAAKLWKFQPARMGNRNVGSECLVHFAFDPGTK